jgi:hypothetical protein
MTNYINAKLSYRIGDTNPIGAAIESLSAEWVKTSTDTLFRSGVLSVAAVAQKVIEADEMVPSFLMIVCLSGTITSFTVSLTKGGNVVTFQHAPDEPFALSGMDDADITVVCAGGTGELAFFVKGT